MNEWTITEDNRKALTEEQTARRNIVYDDERINERLRAGYFSNYEKADSFGRYNIELKVLTEQINACKIELNKNNLGGFRDGLEVLRQQFDFFDGERKADAEEIKKEADELRAEGKKEEEDEMF